MAAPSLSTYGGLSRDIGYAGGIVNMQPTAIASRTNEAAIAIDFGNAVARGAADDTCKAPAADGDKIIGIAVRDGTLHTASAAGTLLYAQRDIVPVMREGEIFVTAFENVTRGDQALSITAQNGKIGGVTGGAAGAGRVAIPGAVWDTTTTAGQLGIVRVNS